MIINLERFPLGNRYGLGGPDSGPKNTGFGFLFSNGRAAFFVIIMFCRHFLFFQTGSAHQERTQVVCNKIGNSQEKKILPPRTGNRTEKANLKSIQTCFFLSLITAMTPTGQLHQSLSFFLSSLGFEDPT